MGLSLLTGLILLMVLAYVYQNHCAEKERKAHAEELKAERTELSLLHITHRDQLLRLFEDHRADIAHLCQRIQAPELAVMEHQAKAIPEADSMPLTDAQIAEQQELAATITRIEQLENEAILR